MGIPVPRAARHRSPAARRLVPAVVLAAASALVFASQGSAATPSVLPAAAVTCKDGVWKASFWSNNKLSGTPRKTVCDSAVNENWGSGHPAVSGLGNDWFSVRWTTVRNFGKGGLFDLKVSGQDGVRVWIGSKQYVNFWADYTTTQSRYVRVKLPAGKQTVRVDYAAAKGAANVRVDLVTADTTPPAAVTGFTAAYAEPKVTLRWTKGTAADIAGYRLYRRSSPTASWTAYTTTTATSLTAAYASDGKRWQYAVRAYDQVGNASPTWPTATITTPNRTPQIWSTDADETGATLSWVHAGSSATAAKYAVYRATSTAGPWTGLATLTVPAPTGTLRNMAYKDTKAPVGIASYYRLVPLRTDGTWVATAYSPGVVRPAAASGAPATPQKLTAAVAGRKVTLKWSGPLPAAGAWWTVYEERTFPADPPGGPRTAPYKAWVPVADKLTTPTWAQTRTAAGTVRYAVTATDSAGRGSRVGATVVGATVQ